MFRCATVTSRRSPVTWPPPPHDPRERLVVAAAEDWQVRSFSPTDAKFAYLAPHGLWHLQLWHPTAHVSVLSPSRLTCGCYEIFPIDEWKRWATDYAALVDLLVANHGVRPPTEGTLAVLQAWFVDEPLRTLTDIA